jgi:hypothetical protein
MIVDLLLFTMVLVISALVFVPLHALFVRANRGRKLLSMVNLAIILSAIIGGAAVWFFFGSAFTAPAVRTVACIGGGIAFLGFGGTYALIGPASVDRSISVHLINLVNQEPDRRMAASDLFRYYPHADVLEKRFVECSEVGVFERHGQDIVLTPYGRRIAMAYAAMGKLLGLRPWYLDRYRSRTTD